ncbi:alpha/beta hydrolase [Klebsiella pneumoniae]|nr:alpha/beta hydrolase [Klebsiella pneumoniae]
MFIRYSIKGDELAEQAQALANRAYEDCLLYTSPRPRDYAAYRKPSYS